jgi:Arc/MetJ-type ribon-helix-helix transcriptional regulator
VKVSVSLPDEDVAFLDSFSADKGLGSRSAALHTAVRLLRSSQLGSAYEDAWQQWETEGEAHAWEPATGDGLGG